MTPKIATCCYCGTRAALVLSEGRHELACASCGAPLHALKMLRTDDQSGRAALGRPDRAPVRSPARGRALAAAPMNRKTKRRRKPKKPGWMRLAAKAWDAIEDIID